jgi:hypothetical protein
VQDDLRQFEKDRRERSPTIDLDALIDNLVRQLKSILARSGGRPPGAIELYPGVFEYEFVGRTVWIQYSRAEKRRGEVEVIVARWSGFSLRETRPR